MTWNAFLLFVLVILWGVVCACGAWILRGYNDFRRAAKQPKKESLEPDELEAARAWYAKQSIGMEVSPGGDPVDALLYLFRSRQRMENMMQQAIQSIEAGHTPPGFIPVRKPNKKEDLN